MTPQHFSTMLRRDAQRNVATRTLLETVTQLLAALKADAPLEERRAATQAVEHAMATYYAQHYEDGA